LNGLVIGQSFNVKQSPQELAHVLSGQRTSLSLHYLLFEQSSTLETQEPSGHSIGFGDKHFYVLGHDF